MTGQWLVDGSLGLLIGHRLLLAALRAWRFLLPLRRCNPTLFRSSQAEGKDYAWVPAGVYKKLATLFGTAEGQDPLERSAFMDEATFSVKIDAFPHPCVIFPTWSRVHGVPQTEFAQTRLFRRSTPVPKVLDWATTTLASHLGPDPSNVRLWWRQQPLEEVIAAGGRAEPGPWRLVDPSKTVEDLALNDPLTELIAERFGAIGWPRGDVVKPGLTGQPELDADETGEAVPFDGAKWRMGLGVGDRLDCMDRCGAWYESVVAGVTAGATPGADVLRIHFRAWTGDRFDEDHMRSSPSLQPRWSRVRNFRRFAVHDCVQVRRLAEGRLLWFDATVQRVTATSVTLVATRVSASSFVVGVDDADICPAGIHLSKDSGNKRATPLVATTGRFEAPAADEGRSSAPAARPAEAAPPAASAARLPSGLVSHPRYGLLEAVHGLDDDVDDGESFDAMAGRSWGASRTAARTPAGVCGLQNLGNTCFMNSMLQCLSNSEPLARYFLEESRWRADVNPENPLGFRGKLAASYAQLMRSMWKGGLSSVAPSLVKEVVARNAPQFRGYQQHDSQELMSYLLDGLHEDCNRVVDKKPTDKVESDGRPDTLVAAESWATHEMRNRSRVQEIFAGQLRSHIQCNVCRHVSLTFDPFTSLSVPIPVPERDARVCTIMPHGPAVGPRPTIQPRLELTYLEFEIAVRGIARAWDTTPGAGFTSPAADADLFAGGAESPRVRAEFAWAKVANMDDRHNRVLQWVHPDEPMRNVDKEDFVFAFMVPGRSPEQWRKDTAAWTDPMAERAASGSGAALAGAGAEREGSAGVPTRVRHPSGALIVSMTRELPAGQQVSFGFPHLVYLPLVQATFDAAGDPVAAMEARMNADARPPQRQVMAAVFEQVSRHLGRSADGFTAEEPPYDAFLVPASAEPVAGDTSDPRNKARPVTWTEAADSGVIAIDPTSDAALPIGGDECEGYVLRLVFRSRGGVAIMSSRGCYDAVPANLGTRYGRSERKAKSSIGLGECMEAFVQREQLGQNDKWYCPKCKDHVRAYKKFDLFNVGECLIVQLKRFRYHNMHTSRYYGTSVSRDKISELVDFPTEDLDLSPYIMGPQPGPHIFDLYAVSEHSGGLGGGHYTATGRNWINGRWYDFNDSFVREARSADDAISVSAYVLFFRRRGGAPLRVPLPRHVTGTGALRDGDPEVDDARRRSAALKAQLEAEGTKP